MQKSVNLVVKGTAYYEARRLLQHGTLSPGLSLRLQHEKRNPHDRNAVAIKVKKDGSMLGHISRDVSHKYATLVDNGRILDVKLSSAIEESKRVKIRIRVTYEENDEQDQTIYISNLWKSTYNIPPEAGVYAIIHRGSRKYYIGSSVNMRERVRSHTSQLFAGSHSNHSLQRDFSHYGSDIFEAKVLEKSYDKSALAYLESKKIQSMLESETALYNLTLDGQGVISNHHGYGNSETISDTFSRQRAREREEERAEIVRYYDAKLDNLLPQTSLWLYFSYSFMGVLAVLSFIVPKINGEDLIVSSVLLGGIVSFFIKSRSVEKTKQSIEYKKLEEEKVRTLKEREKNSKL